MPEQAPRTDGTWSRIASGIVGTLGEAWTELRTHRLRVILSLIGIAVAVAALTAVVALGELQKQATLENSERYGGRIATLTINTHTTDGSPVNWTAADARFDRVNERYGFTHTSRLIDGQVQLPVQLPTGVTQVNSRQYDPAYPVIHRLKLKDGRWFRGSDTELLAPAVVVTEPLWEQLGGVAIASHPTLQMTGPFAGTYQIIGVVAKQGEWDQELRVDMLYDDYLARVGAVPKDTSVTREVWIPGDRAAQIGPVLAMDLRSGLPSGTELSVNRTDTGASPDFEQSFVMMQIITSAISSIVLLLGGLSPVNIQLVAMRQRIREIGVRRSFGASGARIFASVMMESVVATAVAGVLGIVLAVAIVRSPMIMNTLFYGMQDVPAFPFSAAVIGLTAAVATGALAGLVPAIVATRVRVIDAIRY